MSKMEQIAGKSEHLLDNRGFVWFVWVGWFVVFFFFCPLAERGEMLFITAHSLCKIPLLSGDYCIMQDSIFKLG